MAQSGRNEMFGYLSAFGVKRTCAMAPLQPPRSQMTQSGHERSAVAAMTAMTCYSPMIHPWVGLSATKRPVHTLTDQDDV
jgi:hypothetical protein